MLTVAICTYNRAEELRRTLLRFIDATQATSLVWELLIVDNNSHDHTRQVVKTFEGTLPLRYVFEPRQGLSFARNRALAETHSAFIFFTDDDVNVPSGWIEAYADVLQRYPDMDFMGGPIKPVWQETPPDWVFRFVRNWLNGVLVWCDCGEHEHLFDSACDYIYGANFGFRIDAIRDVGGFDVELGRKGRGQLGGEDMRAVEALVQQGYKGFYCPQAPIFHRIGPERWSRRFILKSSIGHGKLLGMQRLQPPRRWIGPFPVGLSLQIVQRCLAYLYGRVTCNPEIWLPSLCRLGWALGEWQEVRSPQTSQR